MPRTDGARVPAVVVVASCYRALLQQPSRRAISIDERKLGGLVREALSPAVRDVRFAEFLEDLADAAQFKRGGEYLAMMHFSDLEFSGLFLFRVDRAKHACRCEIVSTRLDRWLRRTFLALAGNQTGVRAASVLGGLAPSLWATALRLRLSGWRRIRSYPASPPAASP